MNPVICSWIKFLAPEQDWPEVEDPSFCFPFFKADHPFNLYLNKINAVIYSQDSHLPTPNVTRPEDMSKFDLPVRSAQFLRIRQSDLQYSQPSHPTVKKFENLVLVVTVADPKATQIGRWIVTAQVVFAADHFADAIEASAFDLDNPVVDHSTPRAMKVLHGMLFARRQEGSPVGTAPPVTSNAVVVKSEDGKDLTLKLADEAKTFNRLLDADDRCLFCYCNYEFDDEVTYLECNHFSHTECLEPVSEEYCSLVFSVFISRLVCVHKANDYNTVERKFAKIQLSNMQKVNPAWTEDTRIPGGRASINLSSEDGDQQTVPFHLF